MKPDDLKAFLGKNRILLLVLCLGLLLAVSGSRKTEKKEAAVETENELRLAETLKRMNGVGEVRVLLARKDDRNGDYIGAVVVCEGASSPAVRLRITEAVALFTGLGTNDIMVEKLDGGDG